MREILFRGKRLNNGEWVEGFYSPIKRPVFGEMGHFINEGGYRDIEIDPETVGQFTGLLDKNGKRIFDGDIVHYLYEPGKGFWNSNQNSVIEWRSTGFFMRGITGTNKYACSTGWLVSIPHGDGKCFKIIGNIYDNQELLKGGD